MKSDDQEADIKKETPHHKQLELCMNRPAYRQGRKFTAVKVYTVSSESQHLFVYGVPSINLRNELKSLFNKYGEISSIHVVPQQKVEIFTECYHVNYKRIQSARIAKRSVDNKSFYGGVLHVCYAPEYETVEETTVKLQQRKNDVLTRLNKYNSELFKKTKEFTISPKEIKRMKHEKSRKRKLTETVIPPIYHEEDPILCLVKRQKRKTDLNIAKYSSQNSDMDGGPNNNMNSHVKSSKKFIPLPLRHKANSEVPVYGPQLPISTEKLESSEVYSQNNFESITDFGKNDHLNNKSNIRKVPNNAEKRIIFRNKIQNKIT